MFIKLFPKGMPTTIFFPTVSFFSKRRKLNSKSFTKVSCPIILLEIRVSNCLNNLSISGDAQQKNEILENLIVFKNAFVVNLT